MSRGPWVHTVTAILESRIVFLWHFCPPAVCPQLEIMARADKRKNLPDSRKTFFLKAEICAHTFPYIERYLIFFTSYNSMVSYLRMCYSRHGMNIRWKTFFFSVHSWKHRMICALTACSQLTWHPSSTSCGRVHVAWLRAVPCAVPAE